MLQVEAEPSIGMHVWEAVRVTELCALISRVVQGESIAATEVRTSVAFGDRELELNANRMMDAEGQPGAYWLAKLRPAVYASLRADHEQPGWAVCARHQRRITRVALTGLR